MGENDKGYYGNIDIIFNWKYTNILNEENLQILSKLNINKIGIVNYSNSKIKKKSIWFEKYQYMLGKVFSIKNDSIYLIDQD